MSADGLVEISIDGQKVQVPGSTTIYDAAAKLGIKIPILCHREHMSPVGVCRVCVVDTQDRVFAPACCRQAKDVRPGVDVKTHHTSEKVRTSVKVLAEMLTADHLVQKSSQESEPNELEALAKQFGITQSRFPPRKQQRGHDDSSVVIAVDHNACILCDRCVRGCGEIRHNEVLGRRGKGYTAGIAFDLNEPMGNSSCVSCGECMVSCPTGALTFRQNVGQDPWADVTPRPMPVTAAELSTKPLFDGVSKPFLRWNEGSVVRRSFRKGETICREGEYGSTAFLIEQGKVNIFIQSPLKHVKSRKGGGAKVNWGPFGLVRRFTSALVGRGEDEREGESRKRFIHIDAPVSLNYDDPQATLEVGDIFGEMTCMSAYPRSATVRAAEDCTLLEMQRNVLYILQRNKKSRAVLDEKYRQRGVESHLRGVRVFSSLLQDEREFDRFVKFLRPKADLVRVNPGEVIFQQGDPADSFYLVRIGFVKVSQKHLGGEHVLNYLGPGNYFGEIGLMSHIPEIREKAPPGVRVATCSALDHVELVRIDANVFRQALDDFPQLRAQLIQDGLDRLAANERVRRQVEDVPLDEFLRQGLMNAQSLLVLDLEKCTRCDECTKACADAHDGVTRLIREGLRFDRFLVASSCRSCMDPYCLVGCPVDAIHRRDSREIIIEDTCIGCGNCAANCPYGNINMHPFPTGEFALDPLLPGVRVPIVQQKATTCDLCRELDGQPSCVYACPHDAAHRMTGRELLQVVELRTG